MTTTPTINEMRGHLMQTLASLRDRDNPMEPDRARAVAQVATVLVDSAKVEVDYLKATQQGGSAFFDETLVNEEAPQLPSSGSVGQTLKSIAGGVVTRRHICK